MINFDCPSSFAVETPLHRKVSRLCIERYRDKLLVLTRMNFFAERVGDMTRKRYCACQCCQIRVRIADIRSKLCESAPVCVHPDQAHPVDR